MPCKSHPLFFQLSQLSEEHSLPVHVDGARLMNAAVASECSMESLVKPFSSVSICLSKGIGAPVGSVLVGDSGFMKQARRLRKALGGGTRQIGILAAAAHVGLDDAEERISADHKHAQMIAQGIFCSISMVCTMFYT